jgi:hypothetical protein
MNLNKLGYKDKFLEKFLININKEVKIIFTKSIFRRNKI